MNKIYYQGRQCYRNPDHKLTIDRVYEHLYFPAFTEQFGKYMKEVEKSLVGQTDKSGLPLYLHAFRMASALDLAGYNEDLVITALYHDVLEDGVEDIVSYSHVLNKHVKAAVRLLTRKDNQTYIEYIDNIIKEHRKGYVGDIAARVKLMDLNDHLYFNEYISKSLVNRYLKAQSKIERG